MMGTLVEVLWREGARDGDKADAVRETLDRMGETALGMSLFNTDSALVKINDAAGLHPVKVSPEMMEVMVKSREISHMTGGAFDVTVGSVEGLWGDIQRGGAAGRVPDPESLRDALAKVGTSGLRLDKEARTVYLPQKGTRVDLGGIAKGYIIDQGVQSLRERGLACFMINAGGDIRASGCVSRAPAWKVGLQDPFEKGSLLGVFRVRQLAVVTSGSYERYFENEQGRFSHILDPKTGRPVQGPVSVTVVAPTGIIADALATAFMVTGRQGAMPMLRRLEPVWTVFVEADRSIWVDDRLRSIFQAGALPDDMKLRFFSVTGPGAGDEGSSSP